MLYEKNQAEKSLPSALFQNPTAEYRATPFWAWNCELDREELLRQIDIFKEMGYGGYHMHVRSGLSTPYMGEEFIELIRACIEHGKEKEMLSWLYDEDRWPSGFAGGLVTKDPQYRQRLLEFVTDPKDIAGEDARLLARYDISLDDNKCLASYRILSEGEDASGLLRYAFLTRIRPGPRYNNQGYVDTLNPRAIEKFTEVTHDVYAREIGAEFGGSVPAIFTDEPQFAYKGTLPFADSSDKVILPWTDDLEDTFRSAYGESLIAHLPELFWELPEGAASLTRYRYHDHVAERFASAFADTCGKWCEEHGILLTGHMMNEPTLRSQTVSLGETMRSYRAFGLPGIDMLCNHYEFTTAKQCQSAVRQYGRPGMLSELDGVTGWDFDFRGHKLHGDWQAALGVTVRVPHLAWVSMKGEAKRDYPASISYQSSWWREYSSIEDHFARVHTALTRGKPMVRIAVIHPVESYWLHWGPADQTAAKRDKLEHNFLNVTEWLLKGSIDFDFICESLLPSQNEIGGAPLRVGEMAYDAIIVPECETLRSTTLDRLEAFRNAGGTLIFMGDAPEYVDALPSKRAACLFDQSSCISFNRSSLLSALEPFRTVELRREDGRRTSRYIHQLRRDTDGVWLFIAQGEDAFNKDVQNHERIRITLRGEFTPKKWDTSNGTVCPIPFSYRDGCTVISADLYDYDSLLLYLTDGRSADTVAEETPSAPAELRITPTEVPYELTEPNVLMLDLARWKIDDGELQDTEEILRIDAHVRAALGYPKDKSAQPWVIEKVPAVHTVTLEFDLYSDVDYVGAQLALEDADLAKISLNGQPVTYTDRGYYTDRSIRRTPLPVINRGTNLLRITLPFGERDNLERVYVLGSFGVRLIGRKAVLTESAEMLAFDDITRQGLPFYGGSIKYHMDIDCPEDGDYSICIPHYRAATIALYVDGKRSGSVIYPPYRAELGHLSAGHHRITAEVFISRHNCFGHIHCANARHSWIGPACWSTTGSAWTYEYRLLPEGIITTPTISKKQ